MAEKRDRTKYTLLTSIRTVSVAFASTLTRLAQGEVCWDENSLNASMNDRLFDFDPDDPTELSVSIAVCHFNCWNYNQFYTPNSEKLLPV